MTHCPSFMPNTGYSNSKIGASASHRILLEVNDDSEDKARPVKEVSSLILASIISRARNFWYERGTYGYAKLMRYADWRRLGEATEAIHLVSSRCVLSLRGGRELFPTLSDGDVASFTPHRWTFSDADVLNHAVPSLTATGRPQSAE